MTTTTDTTIARTSAQPPTINQKLMSQSFIESAAWWCAVLAVVTGGVAAGFGFFAWFFANKDSEIKAAALKKFQSEATAQTAEASKQAALANERVEALKKANLELEKIVQPRSLTFDQQREIVEKLRKFAGKSANVISYGNDPEAITIATQLLAIFKAAGVRAFDSRSSVVLTGGFEMGVNVRGPDSEKEFVEATALALSSIGKIAASANLAPFRPGSAMISGPGGLLPTTISVTVGIKPIPSIQTIRANPK
jgi:hypothetical protein